MGKTGAAIYERVGMSLASAKRGQLIVKQARPILRAIADIKINIAHAYGIARANVALGELYAQLEELEAVQAKLLPDLNAHTVISAPDGAEESESTHVGTQSRQSVI
jgi:hypothetical protein